MYQHNHCRLPNRNREKERQRQEEKKTRQVHQRQLMGDSVYGIPGHFLRNQDNYYTRKNGHPGYRQPRYGYPGYRHPRYGYPEYRHSGYVQPGYGEQRYRHPGYGDQGYSHPWPSPSSTHVNGDVWEEEEQGRPELETMSEYASEEAFKAKMLEGIDQSDPVNTTRIQSMRAACEKLFSKVNRQLGKMVNQIRETDLYAELQNMNFKGQMNEMQHTFGTELASLNLENEKRNMAYGVVSNKKQSKNYIAELEFQLAGKSNPLKFNNKKHFEDFDFTRGGASNKDKSKNPLINLVRKWESK